MFLSLWSLHYFNHNTFEYKLVIEKKKQMFTYLCSYIAWKNSTNLYKFLPYVLLTSLLEQSWSLSPLIQSSTLWPLLKRSRLFWSFVVDQSIAVRVCSGLKVLIDTAGLLGFPCSSFCYKRSTDEQNCYNIFMEIWCMTFFFTWGKLKTSFFPFEKIIFPGLTNIRKDYS